MPLFFYVLTVYFHFFQGTSFDGCKQNCVLLCASKVLKYSSPLAPTVKIKLNGYTYFMFSFFKKKLSDMWLLVGLGNPGDKYKNNRHNIGFMVMDAVRDEYGLPVWKSKFQSEMSEGRIGDDKVVLLKPQTYMNESGQGIGKAAKFYKIDPSRIVIFHDELDLNAGKMRVKNGGGVAGHNGLKSARAHLGTADFKRVRIGIGHPGDRGAVSGYVLSDFAKSERDVFERLIDGCARHISLLLSDKADGFMTRVAEDIKG